jgi:hypothetical protein
MRIGKKSDKRKKNNNKKKGRTVIRYYRDGIIKFTWNRELIIEDNIPIPIPKIIRKKYQLVMTRCFHNPRSRGVFCHSCE